MSEFNNTYIVHQIKCQKLKNVLKIIHKKFLVFYFENSLKFRLAVMLFPIDNIHKACTYYTFCLPNVNFNYFL